MGGRRVKKIIGEKPATARTAKEKESAKGAKIKKPATAPVPADTGQAKAQKGKKARKVRREKARGKPRKASPRGKRYQEAKKKIEPGKSYPLEEAIKLVKASSYAGFDASVEAHINLGLEADKAEQQIRTLVVLPHGTGKKVKILVFAEGKEAKAVLDVGADEIGDESTIEKIGQGGKIGFDAVVAMPEFMPKLAKIARILGPAGLMPSPKAGTVTDKPAEVVAELKKGRVELRTEKQPIIHTVIGKVSFPEKNLVENLKAIIEELNRVRPAKVSGEYIKSIFLKSTMGPSVRVDPQSL